MYLIVIVNLSLSTVPLIRISSVLRLKMVVLVDLSVEPVVSE